MSKITIQEIADLAGVNKATVSRVINGNRNISEKTRLKVEAIMKQHNYVPNSIARGLAFNKTFTVGFCSDYTDKRAFANPFFYKVLQGIEEIVYNHDHMFLMMSDHNHDNKQSKSTFERIVVEHRVDGLIIPNSLLNERNYELLVKHEMPYVVTGENMLSKDGVPWVDIDNVQAGQILTEHLIDLGCREIMIYAGGAAAERDKFIADRLKGYRKTMENHRLEVRIIEQAEVLKSLYGSDSSESAVEWHPEALICCTHEQLFEILDFENGNPLLSEIALATFDDFPMSKYMKHPVHFVEVDLEMMGKAAASMLFSLMNKEPGVPKSVSIATRIGS
ncbi:LacI family DNA-binding transcriptional regulator [Paenibacillus sp. Marseille-P2973]|uniref:LacI family DNA-binding transcriptional regulator n=1 Tax=Paenibacillus sp. Marseille-P2973 TaxID=1871032 RepID=UPI001B36DB05|nr:LacI family DNA-binding transcriptional regulator [Paenibacillus sp. Marseille-P2973]MBQ4899680.1 LacI family DNA-binding transcriptional regulator [Paenibacillus sp. Marseille-P2973]